MSKQIEDITAELNSVSDALEFISNSIECHESEGREVETGGVAYLVRLVGGRSRRVAELCWAVIDGGHVNDSGAGE